ncbi:retron St85 family RNA-directed DNA polymerase [Hahella ganghwensis]|uniref:retron St85 family RNA-directed DNA polymerase n=1 Tax=Hahella ganghwensis TaxID=286420 RepID=UPI0003781C03|nr:retron St85 family RNA-directed DNA polymerase [Hahella ganghwensis]
MNIEEYLTELLYVGPDLLYKFASTSSRRYKTYQIKKRSGKGVRTIAHPSKELKYIQRLLVEKLEQLLPVSDNAYAYIKGKSIRDNAQQHVNNKYFLKIDFSDFFYSITPDIFFFMLKKHKIEYSQKDQFLLKNLLFWRKERDGGLTLSIGAPSSPLISNFVLYDFDKSINSWCQGNKIVYTRYADDISFSTNKRNALFDVLANVKKTLNDCGLENIKINDSKTIFSSKAHNRHITGVTITNDNKLSIGREKKRLLSSMIHHFSQGNLPKEKYEELSGHLAHAFFIDPDFKNFVIKKYGNEVLKNLFQRK